MRVRRAFWIGAAGAGLFLLFLALSLRLFVAGGIGVGDPLPEFVLYTLDGEAVTPESWRGRPVVLRFSSAGCTACADDFELLGALQAELGQQALVAAVQVGDTPAAVRAALRGRQVHVPVYLDPAGEAARALGLRFVPGVYFVTSRGTLSSAAAAELSRVDLATHIPLMLAGGPDLLDQLKRVSQMIRCRECEGRSIWESDAPTSLELREQVWELLLAGMRGEEILAAFAEQYGEWILMAPPARGFSALVWALPGAALAGGLVAWGRLLARSRRARRSGEAPSGAPASEQEREELLQQIDEYLS